MAIFLALATGNEFTPNAFVFLTTFLLTRLAAYYTFFRLLVKRDLPLFRVFFQGFIILLSSLFLFLIFFNQPFFQIDPSQRYYIVLPTLGLLVSSLVHYLFKVEYWQK
jgi:hypothetical protein